MTTSTSRPLAKNGQLPQHMTSRYIVMRQPKQEDALARGLSNLVYQPNFAHSRRPIFWEEHREGDLSPGFDFEYANALGDPLSHKKYAYLFNERKHAKWPLRRPFEILKLPSELRVEILRYSLKCTHSITIMTWPKFEDLGDVTIGILRTCKQLNREGGQVFYGENHFMFPMTYDWVRVPELLPPHNMHWLKELTMAIPFPEGNRIVYPVGSDPGNLAQLRDRVVSTQSYRVDLLLNRLFRHCLDALAVASSLEKLNFIIPYDWEHTPNYADQHYHASPGEYRWAYKIDDTYMNSSDTWEDLEVFVRHRHDLKVTVVWLYLENYEAYNREEQERMMRRMRHRLGVWDFREAEVEFEDRIWVFPAVETEIDPSDLSQESKSLFREVS